VEGAVAVAAVPVVPGSANWMAVALLAQKRY
jgi:hypothetical protein